MPGLAQAKFFDVGWSQPFLAAMVSSPEPAVFLHQPSSPAIFSGEAPARLLMSEAGVLAPLAPAPQTFSNERQEIVTYVVAEGDTPYSIAAQFGITLSTLLWANKLSDRSVIRPGQELVILPISGVKHEVKRGETIAVIAKRYGVDEDDIIDFNDLPASGEIFVGDTLIIPGGKPPVLLPAPSRRTYPRITQPQLVAGFFIMPTVGRNFGRLHGYNAVDIAGVCGTPVYASAGGAAAIADASGWNGGYGKYVRIRHLNGVETTYAHLRSVAVRPGQTLEQGEFIGEMGTSGRSSGCHVHFEVRGARNPFAR